jgi:hypothetical protein
LTDVYLVTLENNQILRYQAFSLPGSPAGWKNQDLDLSALSDTKGTPVEGHLLKYTGGFWQPSTIDLNDLDGVTVTTPQTGNVLQYSSTFGWYNTNLPTPSPPPSTTDQLPEGTTNLYYTEARVSANTDVAANTAKVGITAQQAADILNNNAKVSLIAGGTTGQALVKTSGTDYDVEWADIAVDVQYHNRYATESETLRAGGAETIELYYSAQADGDGLAESASSDTPAAGYDIRRKLYYSEAGFADPDTGTWTQFTPIGDNTTFNNAKAALLAYLKERTGGTVPISLKMTWEEVAQATLLLDTYTGAAAAYSLRKLRTLYTGDAVEVYNGSSYADIGFDGSGELDTTALAAHCGSNDGFVSRWYDQSGNSNTAAQTTTAAMPKIYDGTNGVTTRNGKPCVLYAKDNRLNFTQTTPVTTFAAYQMDATTSAAIHYLLYHSSNARGLFTGGNIPTGIGIYDGATKSISAGKDTNPHLTIWQYNGTNYELAIDGNSLTSVAAGSNFLVNGIGRITGFPLSIVGGVHEIIIYDSDQSSNRTGIEDNINTFYSIY